jgi:hypothetical protein
MNSELFQGFIVCAVLLGLFWLAMPLIEKRASKRHDFGSRARLDGERKARRIHAAGV